MWHSGDRLTASSSGWVAIVVMLAACGGGDGGEAPDAGPADDGSVDGAMDSGSVDGGEPGDPLFVSADPAYLEMRRALHLESPGNVLEPSRRHGFPMNARSGPVAFGEGEMGRRLPLEPSNGTSRHERGETLFQFLARHADSLGLTLPREELQLPNDPTNPELAEPPPVLNQELPSRVQLLRYHSGLRVVGMGAVGLFDPEGALHAVIMRLLPLPAELVPDPTLSEAQALARIEAELDGLIASDPQLRWLRAAAPIADIERAVELVWHREGLRADAPVRLAYEVVFRLNLHRAYVLVDARTGEVIRAVGTTPAEWHDEGTAVTATALDNLAVEQRIPSTRFEGQLWMGVGTSADTGLFTTGERLSVSDSAGRDDPSLVYYAPIRETADTNEWTLAESERSATGVLPNALSALRWWQERDWRSWDGRGSSVWTGINVNRSDDSSPSLNAWGGGGVIAVGDGQTRTGQTYADSLEVMGHELMHSVIGATSRLQYLDESGAANEALADFFGVVLTGVGDDFSDPTIGEEIGRPIRSVVSPAGFGDPDTYSDLRRIALDSGGVHTNSGILNRAHSLVVRGGSHGGHTVTGVGLARAERILRLANRAPAFGRYATLEEVAAGVVDYCDLLTHLLTRSGDPAADAHRETCDAFFQAYRATELLPGYLQPDLAVESATLGRRDTTVHVRNVSSVAVDRRRFEVEVIDELGESTSTVPWGFGRLVLPGDEITFDLPFLDEAFLGAIATTTIRVLRIRLIPMPTWPNADRWLGNNEITVRAGSDYLADRTVVSDLRPAEDRATLRTTVRNLSSTLGTFAGLTAVYLQRSTASGPFTVAATTPAEVALTETRFGVGTGEEDLPEASLTVPAGAPTPFPATIPVATLPRRYYEPHQVWLNEDAGLPAFEGRPQLYVLIDALDGADEMNETNNLVCVNCRGPGADADTGVVVRLPRSADVTALFPERYHAAAAKLLSERPRPTVLREHSIATLPYRITPSLPGL